MARRDMLPWWLTWMCWPFLIYLVVPVVPFFGVEVTYNWFGLSYTGSPLAPGALFLLAVMFLHGLAAFGLLWGKSWGLSAGFAAAVVGLAISLRETFADAAIEIHWVPLLQLAVIVRLSRLHESWRSGLLVERLPRYL